MSETYVHGYHPRENERLQDQAGTLVDLLHSDTAYRGGSTVLEVGCGVGAQTVTLARRSPDARFISIDVSADSIAEVARIYNADLIVTGGSRHGHLASTLFGNVGRRMIRIAPCPVLVIPSHN